MKKDNNIFIRDGRAPIPRNVNISRVMSANRAKNTKPELLIRNELYKREIRGYRIHPKNIPGKPDIALTRNKIGIFINGCFWHRCPYCKLKIPQSNKYFWENKFAKNKERDKRKIYELKRMGWVTLTLWECQIKKDVNKQILKIEKKIKDKDAK
ncbi:MAG: very short patch repair endonuclease [Ignavibacteria bacterium]|nr:very short patch repair endonuclease [Ignavibacteria bacterium]